MTAEILHEDFIKNDTVLTRRQTRYQKNRDKILDQRKKYYESNKEKAKAYYKQNKGKIAENYQANRDKILSSTKVWKKITVTKHLIITELAAPVSAMPKAHILPPIFSSYLFFRKESVLFAIPASKTTTTLITLSLWR